MSDPAIQRHYVDALGRRHRPPAATIDAIAKAMAGRAWRRRSRAGRAQRARARRSAPPRSASRTARRPTDRPSPAGRFPARLPSAPQERRAGSPPDRGPVRVLPARRLPHLGLGDSALCRAIAPELGHRGSRGSSAARALGEVTRRGDRDDQPAGCAAAAPAAAGQPVPSRPAGCSATRSSSGSPSCRARAS